MKLRTILVLIIFSISLPLMATEQEEYQWDSLAIGGGGFVSAIITNPSKEGLIYARTDVGGAYRWNQEEQRWVALLDWVSESQTGYLGVESLATDSVDPARLYMTVGISYFNNGKSAVLRSDDYGASFSIVDTTNLFKVHGNGMGRQNGEKLVVDPNDNAVLYTGTRWNGLFKSTNMGQSWGRLDALNVTTTPNENGISFVALDTSSTTSGATQRLFVGVSRRGENLYVSNDAGASFSPISGAPTAYMPQRGIVTENGDLIITYANGAGPHAHWSLDEPVDSGQIWKYSIGTASWSNITPNGYSTAFGGISAAPSDGQRLIASTMNTWLLQDNSYGDRFFLSTNGGASWTDIVDRGFDLDPNGLTWVDGQAIHWAGSIEFDPFDTSKVWVTSGNGVFRTDDVDAVNSVWQFQVAGIEETVPLGLVSLKEGALLTVIGDYDGFRHEEPEIYAPRHSPAIGTTSGLAAGENNNGVVVRVGSKMYYSTDQGINWTETNQLKGENGHVAVSTNADIFLHSPSGSNVSYRSTNNGNSWSSIGGLSVGDAYPVADKVNNNKFYVYNTSGNFWASGDGGISFSSVGSIPANGSKYIRAVPGKEGHLWLALYGGGLVRTTNGGMSFSTINGISDCAAVGFGMALPGKSYPTLYIWGEIEGERGVYRSTDEGETWVRINDQDNQFGGPGNGQFVIGDRNVFGRVYMSTAGRGIVYGDTAGFAVDNEAPVVAAGQSFSIAENSMSGAVVGSVSASDADDDTLKNWSVSGEVFSINTLTGEISVVGSLDYETQDSYSLRVQVGDGYALSFEQTVVINLGDINDAPIVLSNPDGQSLTLNDDFSFDVSSYFSDDDGDSLSFSSNNLPEGVSLSTMGVLSAAVVQSLLNSLPLTLIINASDTEFSVPLGLVLQTQNISSSSISSSSSSSISNSNNSGGGGGPMSKLMLVVLLILAGWRSLKALQ